MDFPGEQLLIKMWETLAEKGVGGILQPWQDRRVGQAKIELRTKEMLAIAQAEREVEEIKAGKRTFALSGQKLLRGPDEERFEPTIDPEGLLLVARETEAIASARREINVAKTILHAEEALKNDETPPNHDSVDEDWIHRWRAYASEVSTEDLQYLWGNVLAGEVKRPGTFSPRTLDFLRGLSHREAKEIALLSKYVVDGRVFKVDKQHLEQAGLSFGFMLRMQELGLVSGVESLGLSVTIKAHPNIVLTMTCHGKVLLVSAESQEKEVKAPVYVCTGLLNEIIKIGKFEPDIEYLKKVGAYFKGHGMKVSMASYVPAGNDAIHFFETQEL